jgi:hypothetical protein
MVNNYQRNAGSEDDRDSASLSLLTPLDVGDQVPSSLIRKNKSTDLNNLATISILSLHCDLKRTLSIFYYKVDVSQLEFRQYSPKGSSIFLNLCLK